MTMRFGAVGTVAAGVASCGRRGRAPPIAEEAQEVRKLPPRLQEVVMMRSQVWKQADVAEIMGLSRPRVHAVDALHGARLVADGRSNALSVICASQRGSMFDPGPVSHMEKLVAAEAFADLLELDRPLEETLELIAARKGTEVHDVTVAVLDHPRHQVGMRRIRAAGARVRLECNADIVAGFLAVSPDRSVDLQLGEGSASAGVITAVALKCLGGAMVGRLRPHGNVHERAVAAGYDVTKVLTQDDLVSGESRFFVATGVTSPTATFCAVSAMVAAGSSSPTVASSVSRKRTRSQTRGRARSLCVLAFERLVNDVGERRHQGASTKTFALEVDGDPAQ
jgi:fructose-1,6-bisphosphatase/sedoheptulose 1,7-bisphosphatase-like protein